jgi:uncharacterized Fe-S cluster-containing radical SAM superfamily protein
MYDPVKKAREVERMVCRGDLRKYHRFRAARFYGGIATADCVGCCLTCVFCWSWHVVTKPELRGRFYSPKEVAKRLEATARKKGFKRVRISGNEPTISRAHLIKVLERIPLDILFILETNGILMGHDDTFARDLARFRNLCVRVSLKGTTEDEFSALTGATPEGFSLQLKALENLARAGVEAQPAVMVSFSPPENVAALKKMLGRIAKAYQDIEIEELALYGDVEERLRRLKL